MAKLLNYGGVCLRGSSLVQVFGEGRLVLFFCLC
jgi:hypothetical protein